MRPRLGNAYLACHTGGVGNKKADKRGKSKAVVVKLPKKKCCVSKTKCNRCPLRMLKEGTLPEGYTVKKRKLVKIDHVAHKSAKKVKKAKRAA